MLLSDIGVKLCYSDKWRDIYRGDALEVLARLPSESTDLLVTDPPYGISFMGKDWDRALPNKQIWRECLRVLKPGSFAFVMSIPRADCLARMIISLQDVGFRVDFTSIYWAYASGFPKAQNISKVVDKRLGAEREVIGVEDRRSQFDRCNRTSEAINTNWRNSEGRNDVRDVATRILTSPSSPQAKALDGSYGGFQPKPAVEVIIVAMKPLSEKTFVDQAMKNRKGITWLDDCRIPHNENLAIERDGHKLDTQEQGWGFKAVSRDNQGRFPANLLVSDDVLNDGQNSKGSHDQVFLTQKDSVFGCSGSQIGSNKGFGDSGSFSRYFDLDKWWEERVKLLPTSVQKTFPFLIVPKASKSEKNKGLEGMSSVELGHNRFDTCETCGGYLLQNPDRPSACKCDVPIRKHNTIKGNNHPTVKPLKLMSYLITLGSREGDAVLDPFLGSGTTLLACGSLGRRGIGIEISEKYCEIAVNRCAADTISLIQRGEY